MLSKVLIICCLLLTPVLLLANAGSPVVWFSIFHLLIANFFIGYFESLILSRNKIQNNFYKIILANYISMFIGYFLIAPQFLNLRYGRDPDTIEIFIAFTISFFATLFIEYPFNIWSLKDKKQKGILFNHFLKANIITNSVMLFIYLLLS